MTTAATDAAPLILVVDDDRNSRESLGRALGRDGYRILLAENGKVALEMAREHAVDLVLTDLIMPGLDGLDFLEGLRVVRPEAHAILISAFANVDTAVKAVRRGVTDVLEKPIRLRDVRKAIKRVVETHRLGEKAHRAEGAPAGAPDLVDGIDRPLIGKSPAFLEILDLVERVAPATSTVLLLGESGTGKELIAEAIHRLGPRRAGPLVKVACAALAEGVLEAELFGSEKGAYTGAHAQRLGRFEIAHGGVLFLDEIGELTLPLQVKLLRVLQEGEFERVGGSATIRTDVRVLAATNRDLEAEVAAGRFREDLYWRLNVISLQMPPLCDRPEDIPLLAQHFLDKALDALGGHRRLALDPAVLPVLAAYRWPGNVRELENAMERAVVLARGDRITVDDLPTAVRRSQDDPSLQRRPVIRFEVGQSLETLEHEAIRRTLEAVEGNREAAASVLGISLATLYRRLREMGDAQDAQAEEGPGLFDEAPQAAEDANGSETGAAARATEDEDAPAASDGDEGDDSQRD